MYRPSYHEGRTFEYGLNVGQSMQQRSCPRCFTADAFHVVSLCEVMDTCPACFMLSPPWAVTLCQSVSRVQWDSSNVHPGAPNSTPNDLRSDSAVSGQLRCESDGPGLREREKLCKFISRLHNRDHGFARRMSHRGVFTPPEDPGSSSSVCGICH